MTNENTEYEQLAREVYEEILRAEGFETVDVRHNVKLPGKSGQKHQIDVFWEFVRAGISHRVAVECKNWTDPIPVGRIRDFTAALDDIGNIQGVFITKTGYQSGAKTFADHKGIVLKHLREPTENDLQTLGDLLSLNVRGHIFYFTNLERAIEFDFAWLAANTDLRENDHFEIAGFNCEIEIQDPSGNVLKTFLDLENELPHDSQNEKGRKQVYQFVDEFLHWQDSPYRKLKLDKIAFTYDVESVHTFTRLEGRWAAKAVLEDIQSGQIHIHDKSASLK